MLIFGLASALAADMLYRFPLSLAGSSDFDLYDMGALKSTITEYAVLLSLSVVILLAFTATCVVFQLKKLDMSFGLSKPI